MNEKRKKKLHTYTNISIQMTNDSSLVTWYCVNTMCYFAISFSFFPSIVSLKRWKQHSHKPNRKRTIGWHKNQKHILHFHWKKKTVLVSFKYLFYAFYLRYKRVYVLCSYVLCIFRNSCVLEKITIKSHIYIFLKFSHYHHHHLWWM